MDRRTPQFADPMKRKGTEHYSQVGGAYLLNELPRLSRECKSIQKHLKLNLNVSPSDTMSP